MNNFIGFIVVIVFLVITDKLLDIANAKIDEIQESAKLSKYNVLNKYIDSVQDAIRIAVNTIQQTYVDEIKGTDKWDDNAKLEAKNKAITLAKNIITNDARNAISTIYGDFTTYLCSAIEQAVKENK